MNTKKTNSLLNTCVFLCLFLQAVSIKANDSDHSKVSITQEVWSYYNGQAVLRFTLTNRHGLSVSVTNWGAYVTSIMAPDKKGKLEDLILGYDTAEQYINDCCYNGATVGRYANRITHGRFKIDDNEVQLSVKASGANKGHHLHGGSVGLNKRLWTAKQIGNKVQMHYLSPDNEEGYPGNAKISAIFSLNNQNEFTIRYIASVDKTTPINLISHMYFNLTGNQKRNIDNHRMLIKADKVVEVGPGLLPTGELFSLKNTPFDFSKEKPIAIGLATINAQLKLAGGLDKKHGGYDHTWVFTIYDKRLRTQLHLYEPDSGRRLEIMTTQPGVHVYSGNFMNGSVIGKNNKKMEHRHGIALETQHFPDSVNHANFPSTLVHPEEDYEEVTVYRFTIDE